MKPTLHHCEIRMNRRQMLARLVHGIGLAVAGIVGIPAAVTALAPVLKRRKEEVWQVVGPLADFPVDVVRPATVKVPRQDWAESLREKGIYVWRPTAAEVVVYSRSCTDLGCPINWDPGSETFLCPCHGGIFAKDGERMAGPPKRPLYRYASRIRDGVLEIDLRSTPPMV